MHLRYLVVCSTEVGKKKKILVSRFFRSNYSNQKHVIFDKHPTLTCETTTTKYPNSFQQSSDKVFRRKTIPKPVKERIWRAVYGTSLDGTCKICRFVSISAFQFHAGHIISVNQGGTDDPDNLYPLCATCNLSMQTSSMFEFYQRLWPGESFENMK